VVKNVAGYDLNKLYVGSYGTLAVITEVTFKLRPLPERSVTAALMAKGTQRLAAIARQVQTSELQPASFVLTSVRPKEMPGSNQPGETLLLRFADNEASVSDQAERLRRLCSDEYNLAQVSGDDESALWNSMWKVDDPLSCAVRLSVPLAATLDVYENLSADRGCSVTADLGSGIVRAIWNSEPSGASAIINRHGATARKHSGTLFVEKAPLAVRQQVDAWGKVGAGERLMKAIKEKFDPQGILSPGRFVAGI